jgi:hypothetical protein
MLISGITAKGGCEPSVRQEITDWIFTVDDRCISLFSSLSTASNWPPPKTGISELTINEDELARGRCVEFVGYKSEDISVPELSE